MRLFDARKILVAALVVALGVLIVSSAAFAADDAAVAAKAIFDKYASAVVKVSMVFKTQVSMEGRGAENEESKSESIGTIIDPSGLTVVSLFQTSPEEQFKSMGYGDEKGVKMTAETTDVKIRLASGQEIPAKIVLRAEDLDLTFIRPSEKLATPSPYIDLTQSTKLNVLDQIVNLDRLGRVAGRVPSVSLDRVLAVIEKPRTFYVPATGGSLGSPIFNLEGKVAGILVSRRTPTSGSEAGMMGGAYDDNQIYAVLPADDVLDTAKQAPQEAIVEPKIPEAPPAAVTPPATTPKPATAAPAPKPAPKPAK